MSDDTFVFTAQHRSPAEAELQEAVSAIDGVNIEVNVPPNDLVMEPTTLAYVNGVLGATRIDTISYRGGLLNAVADVLHRFYADVPALADTDSDGIFPIPELVTLIRAAEGGSFPPWADPSKRRY